VSPHVEVVAELMREYIRHEAAKEHSTAGARSLVFGAPRTAR
jgi:hypothetical protein